MYSNVFIFGTNDPYQQALNERIYNSRKPLRKAKRPMKQRNDECIQDRPICKICCVNNACILINPCNHFGLCNSCSLKIFNKGFFEHEGQMKLSSLSPDPRFLESSNYTEMENILQDIYNSMNLCPFCRIPVTNLTYVYNV